MKISLPKLAKVLDRLASDHVGERAAAGAIATRMIAEAGVDWVDVLRPVDSGGQTRRRLAEEKPTFSFNRVSHPQMLALTELLWHCAGISERERTGLDWIRADMSADPYVIQPHAAEWLRQLCRREFAAH